ncbi:MAG: SPOR domain-containing protein [Candidatus Aminicenantes bacterium]|jgi:cell division septation protein DedD
MTNKDYRELQLSSSQLVLIFIAILALGVVIFLLGVSVGKKQAQIADTTQFTSEPLAEKVVEEKPKPAEEPEEKVTEDKKPAEPPEEAIRQELASHQKVKEETKVKPAPIPRSSGYFIQIGAFKNRDSAYMMAEELKDQGFPVQVFDPSPSDRNPLYKVRVGGYETRAQAESELEKLAQAQGKQKSDYFIWRR